MSKAFFSTPELAEWLGVFHTTVRRWIEGGKIKGVRVGRNYKIPADEVIRLLERHGIALPRPLSQYKLKTHRENNLPPRKGSRSPSILQKLLIVEEIDSPALICRGRTILGANRSFAELAGLSQADLIGYDLAEIMDDSSVQRIEGAARCGASDPDESNLDSVGYLVTRRDGKKEVQLRVTALSNVKGVSLLVMEAS